MGFALFVSITAFLLVTLIIFFFGTPWLKRYYAITCTAGLLLCLINWWGGDSSIRDDWSRFWLALYPIVTLQAAPFTLIFYSAYTFFQKMRKDPLSPLPASWKKLS